MFIERETVEQAQVQPCVFRQLSESDSTANKLIILWQSIECPLEIVVDEIWLQDCETGKQSLEITKFFHIKESEICKVRMKKNVIYLFHYQGMIYQDAMPEHTTIRGQFLEKLLNTLTEYIRRKRPELHTRGLRLYNHNQVCYRLENLNTSISV